MQTRFAFGRNWRSYARFVDEPIIERAEQSLRELLGRARLDGCRLLDAGSGSGLFSLAARRLGANVLSFDFDPDSVACTRELKERFRPADQAWTVEAGSVLDRDYLARLGQFDIVYSWGVLHHTGALWQALANLLGSVGPGGLLAISIYNDQGRASRTWARLKRAYNAAPPVLRPALLGLGLVRLWGPTTVRDLLRGRPFASWRSYGSERGMSAWHDVVDWVGGWPFEVAKPEQVFDVCRRAGFELRTLRTCAGGLGCNEFVFVTCASSS